MSIPVETNRFRPAMERLEQREAPAAITLADFYFIQGGRTLSVSQTNIFGVGGVLDNDVDDANNPDSNLGMRLTRFMPPIDLATGLPITTPFTLYTDGTFDFRAPRNFNGTVRFTYQAVTSDGLFSPFTPVSITVRSPARRLVVGADQGSSPAVAVFDASSNNLLMSFNAFDAGFKGGVRVATGEFTGDNIDDIVTAAGPSAGPHVRIFDGRTGTEVASFFAFDQGFAGGLEVAAGDLNDDGFDDLVVAAGSGRDAHVKVFDGLAIGTGFNGNNPADVIASFFAYNPGETNGVRVAVGDIDGDGLYKLVTAPAEGSTRVKAFDVSAGTAVETKNFFAGDPSDTRGLFVTAGDFDGDFFDDIAVGSGSGIPEARIYVRSNVDSTAMVFSRGIAAASTNDDFVADSFATPLNTNVVPNFLVGNVASPGTVPTSLIGAPTNLPANSGRTTGGMRVGVSYANRDQFADLVLAQGPNGFPRVQILDGRDLSTLADITVFSGFFGGLNVGGHF